MTLIDVEVLAERVRSIAAKSFIEEAVRCYKVGAYRSCIVATWIALIYDFVDKFRELALAGDASAVQLVAEFDQIQAKRDTAGALKFERDVLDLAKSSYELISEQECVDLRRLFEDRNRFGHPNLNQDLDVLDASAEVARAHLRNAVEHVLERPPVQGKSALASIRATVDSEYFPRKTQDAVVALSATPLIRAKKTVVRDFFLGCLTSLLREKLNADQFERRLAAAFACRQLHGVVVDSVVNEKVSSIFDQVDDRQLGYLILVISKEPHLLSKVSAGVRIKLKEFVKRIGEADLGILNFASDINFLFEEVNERLSRVTPSQLREFVQKVARAPSRPVISRAVEMLLTSGSWDSSNAICSAISERMIDLLSRDDANKILAAIENPEVKWSFNYPHLVKNIIEKGLLGKAEVLRAAETNEARPVLNMLE
ncbi:hypothetical protein [Xanthomonas sp. CFBP 8445]|uniref:hypothetical protein n=1 Tax=Xanthomonas sp. CFBP 8445 TaxID=2971236 RepID=UPI0021DFA634|nr:hypothetical protein [Xanthomonas sp. CFBP 8445]UYC12709.1 hypothetical protein NUG21_02910 [Xanthomonas sp. CFBP 8445]